MAQRQLATEPPQSGTPTLFHRTSTRSFWDLNLEAHGARKLSCFSFLLFSRRGTGTTIGVAQLRSLNGVGTV